MRLRLSVLCLFVVSLAAATGCGASSKTGKATANSPAAAAVADDASWTPPEQTELSFGDEGGLRGEHAEDPATSFRPNRQEKPRGQVHPAFY